MKEIILKVNGMVCEGCEKRVQNSVKTIKGIKKVVANHKAGTVMVMGKEEIDEKEISEKIINIGFDVIGKDSLL